MLQYQILVSTIHEKKKHRKGQIKTVSSKHQLQHKNNGIKNLTCLMGFILYQIFKIILRVLLKNMTNLLIIFQFKYILTKLKAELFLEYYLDT